MTRLGGFLLFKRLSDWLLYGGGSSPSCEDMVWVLERRKCILVSDQMPDIFQHQMPDIFVEFQWTLPHPHVIS